MPVAAIDTSPVRSSMFPSSSSSSSSSASRVSHFEEKTQEDEDELSTNSMMMKPTMSSKAQRKRGPAAVKASPKIMVPSNVRATAVPTLVAEDDDDAAAVPQEDSTPTEADAEAADQQQPKKKPPTVMSLSTIQSICSLRNDLYTSLELNDKLFLNFGGFSAIDSMEHFPQLKSLWLENNLLTSLVPVAPSVGLAPLKQLRCLYLQNNRLSSLEGLSVLSESLVLLNVSSNSLTSLTGISEMKHLQILDAHQNQIVSVVEEVEKMKDMQYLHTLDLSQNGIGVEVVTGAGTTESDEVKESDESNTTSSSTITPNKQPLPTFFHHLSQIPSLKVLYLKQNPLINHTQQYRRVLTSVCKKLSFLDDRPVSELDHTYAEAWYLGGMQSEKDVKTKNIDEKRAKEERNMEEWKKRKEERKEQLRLIAEEEKKLKADAAVVASSSSSTLPTSTDPTLTQRIYHSSSSPIPASPYHAEIPAVEYSSWLVKQDEMEAEEGKKRKEVEEVQKEVMKTTPAPTTSVPVSNPIPTNSYLSHDPSDEPEISHMKRMLHDILVSNTAMKLGGGGSGADSSSLVGGTKQRKNNVGVSEAALVEEEELVKERKEEQQVQSTPVAVQQVVSVPANTTADDEEEQDIDETSNTYSILESPSISSMYDAMKMNLPKVNMDDDDAEDDEEDEDSESDHEEEDGATMKPDEEQKTDADSKPSSKIKSTPKLPKILGFGVDDGHLINRPLLGRDIYSTSSSSSNQVDDGEEDFVPANNKSNTRPASAVNTKGTSLADLLESRRTARLGSANRVATVPVAARPAQSNASLMEQYASETGVPSSSASGVTAHSLLSSFIHAQSSSAAKKKEVDEEKSINSNAAPSSKSPVSNPSSSMNSLWQTASNALEYERTQQSDDDDDDDEGNSAPVADPRAASAEARRQARLQQGK